MISIFSNLWRCNIIISSSIGLVLLSIIAKFMEAQHFEDIVEIGDISVR